MKLNLMIDTLMFCCTLQGVVLYLSVLVVTVTQLGWGLRITAVLKKKEQCI